MNKTNLSIVLFRRKGCVISPYNDSKLPYPCEFNPETKEMVATICKNLYDYGFKLDEKSFNILALKFNKEDIVDWYNKVLLISIKQYLGDDVEYNCMYPNFPQQVMNMSNAELYINAIIHYMSDGRLVPYYETEQRTPLIEVDKFEKLKTISIITPYEAIQMIKEITTNLISSKVSLSVIDTNDINVFSSNTYDEVNIDVYRVLKYFGDFIIPNDIEIPNKENLASLSLLLFYTKGIDFIKNKYKTATDVLRYLAYVNTSDSSLSKPCHYRNIPRRHRKILMSVLDNIAIQNEELDYFTSRNPSVDIGGLNPRMIEDMYRYRERWLRVGERVHPYTYSKQYPNAVKMFFILRNYSKCPIRSFNGHLTKLIDDFKHNQNLIVSICGMCSTRPGEFARNLNRILSACKNPNDSKLVIREFKNVADKIPVPILIQLFQYFSHRASDDEKTSRVFFLKGSTAKIKVIPYNLKDLESDICTEVAGVCAKAIISKQSNLDKLGNVYVDKDFKNFIVPFNLRSASPSSKNITRGSHISISDSTNILRSFIWWTGDVDVDLSAGVFSEDFKSISHISFTNLKSDIGCHSGDITNGGPEDGAGVAEFIDIDINKVIKTGGRYVILSVHNFSRKHFSSMKNCCFGWMYRNDMNSGEIFEPSTVQDRIDVNAESTTCVPVIFDCINREFIWCDMTYDILANISNTIENGSNKVIEIVKAIIDIGRPNLYDLIVLNACARGNLVSDPKTADIIFSNDQHIIEDNDSVRFVTAYDTDYYVSNMM